MIYDLAIVGGGPAGVAGGVYAARKKLATLFLTPEFGGQSNVSPEIQNWIGAISVSGEELAQKLKAHLAAYRGPTLEIKEGRRAAGLSRQDQFFIVIDDRGETYQAKTVLVATGARRRQLTVPGAKEFEQKGITYCASCDAPLFAGKKVAVIGGGNAGVETALQLLAYAEQVTLLHRREQLKADPITTDKLAGQPRATILLNAEIEAVRGDKFVNALIYRDKKTDEQKTLAVEGIFVEIGLVPNTDWIKELVTLNNYGMIVVDPRTQKTSTAGIWAAGDCADGLYHQNNIAAGDAIKAVEDIYNYVR